MSTNFYARNNPCETCGRSNEEIHIGKSSCGWTFAFHATDEIRSYKEWLIFLSKKDIKIVDEYNNKWSLQEFIDLVESKRRAENNHTKACINSVYDNSYLDDEGNSMSPHDFS